MMKIHTCVLKVYMALTIYTIICHGRQIYGGGTAPSVERSKTIKLGRHYLSRTAKLLS